MSSSDGSIGSKLYSQGWRCGSTVPSELYARLKPYMRHASEPEPGDIALSDWLIVVSQTCDLVAIKSSQEQFAEILWCKPIAKPRKGRMNLQSTRYLDFRPNRQDHANVCLEAHASHSKFMVPRNLLANSKPRDDRIVSSNAVLLIQAWYALRYSRPAWPEDLVGRLRQKQDEMEHCLASLDDDRTELRVQWRKPEGEGVAYVAAVFLVVEESTWREDVAYRANAFKSFHDFIAVLRSCPGIEVDDLSAPQNGAEFSWQLMRVTEKWDFANLTGLD